MNRSNERDKSPRGKVPEPRECPWRRRGEKPPHPGGPLLLGVGRPVRPLRPRTREAPREAPGKPPGGRVQLLHLPLPSRPRPTCPGRKPHPSVATSGRLPPATEGGIPVEQLETKGRSQAPDTPRKASPSAKGHQRAPLGPPARGRVLCPSLGAESPQAWETRGQDGA